MKLYIIENENHTQITADFVIMSHKHLCICSWNVPMCKSQWKLLWDLVSIFTAEIIDRNM